MALETSNLSLSVEQVFEKIQNAKDAESEYDEIIIQEMDSDDLEFSDAELVRISFDDIYTKFFETDKAEDAKDTSIQKRRDLTKLEDNLEQKDFMEEEMLKNAGAMKNMAEQFGH